MLTKTIKISEKTHESLMQLASKNQTFNDVINFLINYYCENEELSDEEAAFYNKEIEKFENGNLENVCEVTLEELEQRIIKLENGIKKWNTSCWTWSCEKIFLNNIYFGVWGGDNAQLLDMESKVNC